MTDELRRVVPVTEQLRPLEPVRNRLRVAGYTVELVRHAARQTDGRAWSAYLLEGDQPIGGQHRTRAALIDWLRSPEGTWVVKREAESA